jgi:predicted amidohydrolase YtcJ
MVSKLVTSKSISRLALLISLALGCGGPSGYIDKHPESGPSLIVENADVITPDGHFDAIAIKGSSIYAVGPKARLHRGHARVIDAKGGTVIVGLTDAHCHLYGLGMDIENVSVRGLDSEQAVVDVIAKAAQSRPSTEWLVGRGWDQNRWPGQQFPTKKTLDAINDRPVLLRRIDGHASWVNSRALAAAGITKATPDPAGGKILRDANGEPTGVFVDNAQDLIDAKMPAASGETRERRILAAAQIAVENGFTAVHEMGIEKETAEVYRKLAAEHRLPLRVYAYLLGDPAHVDTQLADKPQPPVGLFAMNGVKFFIDGALGSRGARLYADYDDDKGNRGLWVTEPAALTHAVDVAVAHGWQTAIHAIGDAGVGAVLDAYEKHPGLRLRVEHTQIIAEQDVPRMVKSQAIASMQPTHATSDMPWAEARIGKERIKGAYAWRTMLNNKIPLAFGSDFPVEEVSPLLGLHAAVTRTDTKGQPAGGWYADQRMTLDEAVAGFTTGAAYAAFVDGPPHADLTIYDGKLDATNLLQRKVAMTIVDGKVVYDANDTGDGKVVRTDAGAGAEAKTN